MQFEQMTFVNQMLADALENGQIEQEIKSLQDAGLIKLDFDFTEGREYNRTFSYIGFSGPTAGFEYVTRGAEKQLIFQLGTIFTELTA